MKIENKQYLGDYKINCLNDKRLVTDFPEWMSKVAKKLAQETINDALDKKSKFPSVFPENGDVAFEVSVSISTFKNQVNDEEDNV